MGHRHFNSVAEFQAAFGLAVGFMAMMALLMLLAPGLLIGAFLDLSNARHAEVVGLAVVAVLTITRWVRRDALGLVPRR
jgi:Na+-driven multidrug efflux pump